MILLEEHKRVWSTTKTDHNLENKINMYKFDMTFCASIKSTYVI